MNVCERFTTVSGAHLSPIGIGTWGIGGTYSFGAKPEGIPEVSGEDPVEVMQEAFQAGINVFDTSVRYGKAAERLAEAFQGKRDQVFIAAKGGIMQNGARSYSRETLQKAIYQSLRRLQTEYLDLFQVTCGRNAHFPLETLLELLTEFRQQNLTRYIGFSIATPQQGLQVFRTGTEIDSLQITLNLLDLRMLELLTLCAEHDVLPFIKSPLNKGVLTNRPYHDNFSPDDARQTFLSKETLALRRQVAGKILVEAGFREDALHRVAVQFLLSLPAMGTILFGIRTRDHIHQLMQFYQEKRLTGSQINALCQGAFRYFHEIEPTL